MPIPARKSVCVVGTHQSAYCQLLHRRRANRAAVEMRSLLFLTSFNYSCGYVYLFGLWLCKSIPGRCSIVLTFSHNQSKFNLTHFCAFSSFCRFANTANNRASDWYGCAAPRASYIKLQSRRIADSRHSLDEGWRSSEHRTRLASRPAAKRSAVFPQGKFNRGILRMSFCLGRRQIKYELRK